MSAYYPVFLDIRARRCVVVGGGALAEEKVERLEDYGANTVVIAPELTQKLQEMAVQNEIVWINRGYRDGDLEGAFIAIVADTSDALVNKAVSTEATARNVPLNVNDVTHLCTWIAPAVVKRGDVIVAASTGGASPALARKFREELNGTSRTGSRHEVMDYADLAPLLTEARQELLRDGIRVKPDHWQACLGDDLVDMVHEGRNEEARSALMERLKVGVECDCPQTSCRMWDELLAASAHEAVSAPEPS